MKHARAASPLPLPLTLAAPFAASAQENESPYSWNVTAVSDYLFRGVSQTDEKPTLQAGSHLAGGPRAGVWVRAWTRSGRSEHRDDYQIGYGVDVTSRVNFDVLLNRYTYLGATQNYNELVTTTTLDDLQATVAYTNDQWNSGTDGWYYGLGGSWGLPKDFTLNANVGRSTFEDGIAGLYRLERRRQPPVRPVQRRPGLLRHRRQWTRERAAGPQPGAADRGWA